MPVTKKRLSEFDKMSEEELEDVIRKNSEERAALREEAIAAHDALDKLIASRVALQKMEGMSPSEIEAMMTYVKAHGIPSEEKMQGE